MTATLVKCSSAQCAKRDFFPNQLTTVIAGDKTYIPCPECNQALMEKISNRDFLRGMIKATMTMGEVVRMRNERARIYAESQTAQVAAGYPRGSMLPYPEVA